VFLAKSAAYVLGYMDGLNMSLEELSAETSERLSGSYFEPTFNAMHEALREMRQRYPDGWQDLDIYDGLAEALERYYVAMGLVLYHQGWTNIRRRTPQARNDTISETANYASSAHQGAARLRDAFQQSG
jgi:hypothetical protein